MDTKYGVRNMRGRYVACLSHEVSLSGVNLSLFPKVCCAGAIAWPWHSPWSRVISERVGHDFTCSGRQAATSPRGTHSSTGYLPGAPSFKYPPFAALVFSRSACCPSQSPRSCSHCSISHCGGRGTPNPNIVAQRPRFAVRYLGFRFLLRLCVLTAHLFLALSPRADQRGHPRPDPARHPRVPAERDVAAAAYIVTATSIKRQSDFFVAWLLIRGRRRAALAVLPLAAASILVPLLVRGPPDPARPSSGSITSRFSSVTSTRRLAPISAGHNIASFVNRVMLPERSRTAAPRRDTAASDRTAQLIYRAAWAAVATRLPREARCSYGSEALRFHPSSSA